MAGEADLDRLIAELNPELNKGEYIFTSVTDLEGIDCSFPLCVLKEKEGITVVLERGKADELNLKYDFVASWITLSVHSSLRAVGLTAAVSSILAENNLNCNVIAGYFHDHVFVEKRNTKQAIELLENLSKSHKK